jgi:hypothetical protein
VKGGHVKTGRIMIKDFVNLFMNVYIKLGILAIALIVCIQVVGHTGRGLTVWASLR